MFLAGGMGWKTVVFNGRYGLENSRFCREAWVGKQLFLARGMGWKAVVFSGRYGLENSGF